MKIGQLKWALLVGAIGLGVTGWLLLPAPSPFVSNPNAGPTCVYTLECPQFFRFFTITNATFAASMVIAVITVWAFVLDRRIKIKAETRDAQRFAWEQQERTEKLMADKDAHNGDDHR